MTKKKKIAVLEVAMTQSRRKEDDEDSTFHHFTDQAPQELKDLFLEHYNVANLDYEIFNRACDLVSEVYADMPKAKDDDIQDAIYERSSDSANVYTRTRLDYLNPWNEQEIGELMSEYGEKSIANACAIWYDKQVEQAAMIIHGWVIEK